jgi:IS4 transposase
VTDAAGKQLYLATSLMEIDADLVGEIYRSRWQVELFFRWMKCILGCQHLISEKSNGVAIQVYGALIASVLIALWTGKRPNKRIYELAAALS